jgi:hypothetical protein
MSLKSSDLYATHDKLVKMKLNTYHKIYKKCENIIKLNSKQGKLMCTFEIPSLLFGSEYPSVNVENCANYIINKLNEVSENIKITFIQPNLLFIDWRRENEIIIP